MEKPRCLYYMLVVVCSAAFLLYVILGRQQWTLHDLEQRPVNALAKMQTLLPRLRDMQQNIRNIKQNKRDNAKSIQSIQSTTKWIADSTRRPFNNTQNVPDIGLRRSHFQPMVSEMVARTNITETTLGIGVSSAASPNQTKTDKFGALTKNAEHLSVRKNHSSWVVFAVNKRPTTTVVPQPEPWLDAGIIAQYLDHVTDYFRRTSAIGGGHVTMKVPPLDLNSKRGAPSTQNNHGLGPVVKLPRSEHSDDDSDVVGEMVAAEAGGMYVKRGGLTEKDLQKTVSGVVPEGC